MSEGGRLWRFDDVRVDEREARVWKGGQPIELEPKAFGVLCHLVERHGQLVSKQELFDTVWNGIAVTDNALTRVVAQLRKAIGDDPRQARYIETVPTRGYRFIAPVITEPSHPEHPEHPRHPEPRHPEPSSHASLTFEPAPDAAPHAAPGPAREPASQSADRLTGYRIATAFGVALAAGIIALIAWMASAGGPRTLTSFGSRAQADTGALSREISSTTQVSVSIGLDAFPSFSPDGGTLVFSSDRGGTFELFTRTLVPGGQERALTNDGQQNILPDWSPDGQWLAYHSMAGGGIWALPASGGATRQLTAPGAAPRWSPDGTLIVFQTGEPATVEGVVPLSPSTLRLVTFPGGETRDLTVAGKPAGGHGQPSWSPDGHRVAFISSSLPVGEVWLVDVADGALTRLVECPSYCRNPAFSTDGRTLFYTTYPQRQLWAVALAADGKTPAGQPARVQVPGGGGPSIDSLRFDRHGRQFAFGTVWTNSNLEGLRLRPDGTAEPEIEAITRDRSDRNTFPVMSQDGRRLAYVSRRIGAGTQVWIANADGTDKQQLTLASTTNVIPSWMPGNDEVAYHIVRDSQIELVATSISTRRTRPLLVLAPDLNMGRMPVLSRMPRLLSNGRELMHGWKDGDDTNLWLTDIQTKKSRQLTWDKELAGWPVASNDGKWVAYERVYPDRTPLVVSAIDSHEEGRALTSDRGYVWPGSWAPDNTRIAVAFQREGVWNLGWVSRVDGRVHPLTSMTSAAGFVRYPAWSAANDRIVYERATVTGNVWLGTLR